MPEKMPFRITISYVLFEEIILVQLFSSPQHIEAPITMSDPVENLKFEVPSNDNTILDKVIIISATHIFLDMFS